MMSLKDLGQSIWDLWHLPALLAYREMWQNPTLNVSILENLDKITSPQNVTGLDVLSSKRFHLLGSYKFSSFPLHYSASSISRTTKCPILIHYPMHTPPFLKLCNFFSAWEQWLDCLSSSFFQLQIWFYIYIYLQFMHNTVCVYIDLMPVHFTSESPSKSPPQIINTCFSFPGF